MKRLIILLDLCLFCFVHALAQNFNVTGKVADYETGDLIPGVTIKVNGTDTGTITDVNGIYSIHVSPDAVLEVSYMGYKTKNVKVNNQRIINIRLQEASYMVDELVVVGYGSLRKSDLTGAMTSLAPDDLNKNSTNTDITSMLEGRVAGVLINPNEGGPGAGMSIQIRGASSLTANSEPLYVIDGFPIEITDTEVPTAGFSSKQQSPIANIDPNNIESIEILKDASATAIYGARGANGVVLITTKTGKVGKPKVTLNITAGFQHVSRRQDVMNSREYAEYMWHRSFTKEKNPYLAEQNALTIQDENRPYYNYETYTDSLSTDWQDLMYKTGVNQNYNLNISGGSDRVQYNISGGYYSDEGVLDNNRFQRYSLDTKLHGDITRKLKFDLSLRLGHTLSDGVATGVGNNATNFGVINQILRYSPLKNSEDMMQPSGDDSDLTIEEQNNPYLFVRDVTNSSNSTRIISNLAMTYFFTKNLSYKASIGTNINMVKYESFYPKTTGKGHRTNGLANMGNNQTRSWVHESVITYNKAFNKNHRLNLMGAFTAEQRYANRLNVVNRQFALDDLGTDNLGIGIDPEIPASSNDKNSLASFLARINYTLRNRYLFTLSGRADGSSRFGNDNKWAFFPSGSVAWRMSEEKWLKNQDWMSNLKLRLSYGITGNQGIGDYETMAVMGPSNYVFNNSMVSGLSLVRIDNDDLKWETTRQTDFGIDLGLWNNRLQFTADLYYKKTVDMLMNIKVPSVTGYDDYRMNYGSVENKGLELSLSGLVVNTDDFSWDISTNFTFNRNKVLSLGNVDYIAEEYSRVIVGKPIGQFWGFKQVGIIESEEEAKIYNQGGTFPTRMTMGQRKFADVDKTGSVYDENGNPIKIIIDDNDRTIIGSYEPKFYGGLSTNFRYKEYSLNVQCTFRCGGDIFNGNKADLISYEKNFNRHVEALDYWRPAVFDDNGTMIDAGNLKATNPHPSSYDLAKQVDVWVEDGSYFKLSSLTLNYTFNRKTLSKIHLASLNVFARGSNLFTITGYSGTDPQANMGRKLSPGYDRGGQPFLRNFSFGVNIGF